MQHAAASHDDIRSIAEANPFDKFSLGVQALIQELLIDRRAENDALVTRYVGDAEFREVVAVGLLRGIFDAIASKQAEPPSFPG